MKPRHRIHRHRLITLAWAMAWLVVSVLVAGQGAAQAAAETQAKAVDLSVEAIDQYYENGLDEVRRTFASDFKRALPVWQPGDAPDQGTQDTNIALAFPQKARLPINGILRELPHPYQHGLVLENSTADQRLNDAYVRQMILARRFGIDLPAPFHAFDPAFATERVAFIDGLFDKPRLGPQSLFRDVVDAMPVFLDLCYRGGLGTMAAWMPAADSITIVDPQSFAIADSGELSATLTLARMPTGSWHAIDLDVSVDKPIKDFELILTDALGIDHAIVYRRALGDRQGWDITTDLAAGKRRLILSLGQETNRRAYQIWGNGDDPRLITKARLTASGRSGAAIHIHALGVKRLTMAQLDAQRQLLRKFNIPLADENKMAGQQSKTDGPTPSGMKGAFLTRLPVDMNQLLPKAMLADPGSVRPALASQLADLRYNLSGQQDASKRVWVTVPAVAARLQEATRLLRGRIHKKGHRIVIDPVADGQSGKTFPDARFLTQDLHGLTFKVDDATRAKVVCGRAEITSLQRHQPGSNGSDFVTIVDDSTPRTVFDEVDFYEQNGRLWRDNANYFFVRRHAARGAYALELESVRGGESRIIWRPFDLDNFDADYFRFSYRKTNPDSRIVIGWSDGERSEIVAVEGAAPDRQGWELPSFNDSATHAVVLDLADTMPDGQGTRRIPRMAVRQFYLGLKDARPGDSVFFDAVAFLSVKGQRPSAADTRVIGGRLYPHQDNEVVKLTTAGKTVTTTTGRGGWYFFNAVPRDAVFEITCRLDNHLFFPARGRLSQATRNDIGYDIYATDRRSNSVPRPDYGDLVWNFKLRNKSHKIVRPTQIRDDFNKEVRNRYKGHFFPHQRRIFPGPAKKPMEFFADEQVNNFGNIDKDRRIGRADPALRILLLGGCWLEGMQTHVNQHTNVFLESFLRRETGVNVEVISQASPDTTLGHNGVVYEQYGKQFKADVILDFSTQIDLFMLEPSLYARHRGMPKGHAHKNTFDFDAHGNLQVIPKSSDFGAFRTDRDEKELVPGVPMTMTGFATAPYPPVFLKATQLLEGILAERIIADAAGYGAAVGVIYGYHANTCAADYRLKSGTTALVRERWLFVMDKMCQDIGAFPIDLSDSMCRAATVAWRSWERNWHPSPYGHYMIARGIADRLLQWPDFMTVVKKVRNTQTTPAEN